MVFDEEQEASRPNRVLDMPASDEWVQRLKGSMKDGFLAALGHRSSICIGDTYLVAVTSDLIRTHSRPRISNSEKIKQLNDMFGNSLHILVTEILSLSLIHI